MRRSILFICFYFICVMAFSQSYDPCLPSLGKFTYRCNFNGYIQPMFFNKESASHYDFNFLSTSWSVKEVFRPTTASQYKKQFSKASLVHLKVNNEVEFYNVNNHSCFVYGKVVDSKNSRKPLLINYLPHDLRYTTSMRVGNKYNNNYRTEIKIAKTDLIYTNLNAVADDSIKVEITTKENVNVTFEGTIELSGKTRKARRYEAQINNTLVVYTKKIGSQWKQSNISSTALPSELTALYKSKSYTKVFFLSPDFVGPIVTYDLIDGEIKNIAYQENEVSPLSVNIAFDEGEIIAWPNPTIGPITFEIFNYPYDEYKLEVYNIVGKKILEKSFTPADGRSLDTDLSSLKKGTYIYSFFDGKGRKLLTKRVAITSI